MRGPPPDPTCCPALPRAVQGRWLMARRGKSSADTEGVNSIVLVPFVQIFCSRKPILLLVERYSILRRDIWRVILPALQWVCCQSGMQGRPACCPAKYRRQERKGTTMRLLSRSGLDQLRLTSKVNICASASALRTPSKSSTLVEEMLFSLPYGSSQGTPTPSSFVCS